MDDEKVNLRKRIQGASSDFERDSLIQQLQEVEIRIHRELDEEKKTLG